MSELAQLVALHKESNALQAAWDRQILTLAAGALALLAGLGPEVPPAGAARYCLAATWGCLGTGICAGGGAAYLEVSRARNLAQRYGEVLRSSLETGTAMSIVVAPPSRIFVLCRSLMILSLMGAVLCLVTYAVMTTLA